MAISSNTVWEVRTAGSDTNGGGYVTASTGTDYSQQDTKNTVGSNISVTDAVANGTTTITSATAAFTSAITGNIVYFSGGTGTITGTWRQATFVSATSITIDVLIAASTGMTMNIGGALLSPAVACAAKVVFNTVWIKTGTYLMTTASTNVAGGCISDATGGTGVKGWEGYAVTRGDLGTPPVLQASGISTATLFTMTGAAGANGLIRNLVIDGNNLTAITGFAQQRRTLFVLVTFKNCTTAGFANNSSGSTLISCLATNNLAGFGGSSPSVVYFNCVSTANTGTGFASGTFVDCLSYNNTGASSDGFTVTTTLCVNSTAYGNGRDGFRGSGGEAVSVINCIAENNVGTGFSCLALSPAWYSLNCATYNNTGGSISSNFGVILNPVVGSSSFFVNAAAGNFALNNTAGAGASARAAGAPSPGLFVLGLTASFPDIGAAQHQDTPSTNLFIISD